MRDRRPSICNFTKFPNFIQNVEYVVQRENDAFVRTFYKDSVKIYEISTKTYKLLTYQC